MGRHANFTMIGVVLILMVKISFVLSDNFQDTLGHIKAKTLPDVQASAVNDLIKRIIPSRSSQFIIEIIPNFGPVGKESFHLETLPNNTVKITATTGVSAATAFNIYLKYHCNSHISWDFTQIDLPAILPKANISKTLNDRFRYYQNVCTTSYSFVWWNWNQWEKHIDWMALNSFNLVLAFNGQEAIWKRVYQKLNLTQEEIDQQFTGPAFLAWERMGNIRGFGGPLSDSWHRRSIILQKQILYRMRELGIIPVLPAFAGFVPEAFKRVFPNVTITQMVWNNFNTTYQPYLLDPSEDLFQDVADMFMDEMIDEFGTDHVYNCDTFNEILPPSSDLDYIRKSGQSVYSGMTKTDPKAIWVMQNWLFVNEFIYWTPDKVKSLVTSVPLGKMIVLDLQSEQFPQYARLDDYYGQPFIWNMLHDFGGTLGMFGSAPVINQGPFEARKSKGMIGTGLTPEGINQNYIIYELMSEMAWQEKPVNLGQWFSQYAKRRYQVEEEHVKTAWAILSGSVYDFPGTQRIRGKYTMNRSPRTKIIVSYWYNMCDVYRAWLLFMDGADTLRHNLGFQHDLVDLTRQILQLIGDSIYKEMMFVYKRKDAFSFNNGINQFLTLFDDMDKILATNKEFLLGQWLNSAKNASDNQKDRELYEYNARNQVTLWGPNGEIKDYANKQWAGMVADMFKPRWKLFLTAMLTALQNNKKFNESAARLKVFQDIEEPFTFDRKEYPEEPQGDTVEVTKDIYRRWASKIRCDTDSDSL